jgi:branched-chain amino acid transport system substrate-binding protein
MTAGSLRALSVLCLALLLASCGGGRTASIRVAVLVDCEGLYGFAGDASDAGAELPLIQHGARLLGPNPSSGITETAIAGKRIQLLFGCGDDTTKTALSQARRLVEYRGAEILIGPTGDGESFSIAEYARRRPQTTFLAGTSLAQSQTLDDPTSNFFRFTPDAAQLSAGLGAYAYHTLGWRRAVTVAEDQGGFGQGLQYTQVAGFVAEFCALGGQIVDRVWSPRDLSTYATRHQTDGFFVLYPSNFQTEFGALHGSLAKRIVGGLYMGPLVGPELEQRLLGVVTAQWPASTVSNRSAWDDYLAAMHDVFPNLDSQTIFPVAYYDAMTAVLQALERVHGDLSGGERRYQAALAEVRLNSPAGPITLDQNHQAVVTNYLAQYQRDADGAITYRTIRVVANVDESFGGYFHTDGPEPSDDFPSCRAGNPPPWARSG